MSSCILYQNEAKTAILLDIPKSIELAQGISEEPCLRRLVSCKPLDKPFPSVEPKSVKAKAKFGETPIKSLLLEKHIYFAWEEVKEQKTGHWCLPRITHHEDEGPPSKKRKTGSSKTCQNNAAESLKSSPFLPSSRTENSQDGTKVLLGSEIPEFCQNGSSETKVLTCSSVKASGRFSIYIPPNSTLVNRFITGPESFILPNGNIFPDEGFNLIILDPPWPNRSVQRKANYSISSSTAMIETLLSSIPIRSLLAPEGLVALWITNKPIFHNLIFEPGGIFEQWGVELIEEWVWVKVTKDGEPMCELNGSWRKPYEILLVGRKIPTGLESKGSSETGEEEVGTKRRVIFAVPDIHSRKPNLKEVFEDSGLLPPAGEYEALEMFARNMTVGWWAWGNEAMEFQKDDYWVSLDSHQKRLST